MKYRQLGKTGLKVSEIGYGAWGIGQSEWVGAEDEVSLQALRAARDAGVNFFDTALAYGMGHSEQLIARAFGKSTEVIIASKVPPKNFIWPAQPGVPLRDVFPKQYVLTSLDQTLKNLGREAVDLYQFHVWNDDWADNEEWLSTVREIRASGKVRFLGISINDHQPANSLKALATGLIDAVQVIYNIFDQSPDDELLPCCQKHRIGVLARVPFDEGSLTGKIRPDTTFPEGDFRHQYFGGKRKQEVWERVQRLTKDAAIPLDQLPQLALRFCLSHPAVSTVIPGMRNAAHVASNAAASDAGPLTAALLAKIHPYRWVRNFYD
jgi:aryl-alcohol dehydrogenase-like predicted oxidoreductase